MSYWSPIESRDTSGWNEAEPDKGMLTMIALSGALGEAAQVKAEAKINARLRAKPSRK